MKLTPILISLIIPASVVFVVSFMQYFSHKESLKMTKGSFCVSLHKGYVFIAVAEIAMMTVIWVGTYLQQNIVTDNMWGRLLMDVAMAALVFLGIGGTIHILFHKIKVEGNRITVFRPLRKTFSCSFSDIESVKKRNPKNQYNIAKITVRTYSGKKFSFDSTEIAYDRFEKSLCNKVIRSKLIGFDEDSNFNHSRKKKK